MSSKKILVTGANGQLGMEFRRLKNVNPDFDFIFVSREQLPIENKALVDALFAEQQPDWCINCAAYTAVDKAESEQEAAFLINGTAVGYLAQASAQHGAGFIHISTDYVFDGTAGRPLRESDEVSPVNVYGASKLEGEMQAIQYHPGAVIFRTSWVYSEFGKNFVKTMIRLMQEKPAISVVNDQIGSPTYAADLARSIMGITQSADKVPPGIYNYSNEGVISWYDFAIGIKKLIQSNCEITPIASSSYPTPARRPMYSVLDKEKFSATFAQKVPDWSESLARCISRLQSPDRASD